MLIGNVGNDPEIRVVSGQSGTRVANFSLATNRTWTDRNSGAKQERTEWHAITVWGRLTDVVEQWVKKGDRLYIEGRIEYSKTGDGDTAKYYTNIIVDEMVMLGSANRDGGGGGGGGGQSQQQREGGQGQQPEKGKAQTGAHGNQPDDDLPFRLAA
jgi:single-strand DNA-binding protein